MLLMTLVCFQGMVHVLHTIAAKEGMAGLWKGAVPAVQRAALVNLGELATYDMVRWLGLSHLNIADQSIRLPAVAHDLVTHMRMSVQAVVPTAPHYFLPDPSG